MKCKKCGSAIHKCSSANEYHADDRDEYMKELKCAGGCVHEPESAEHRVHLDAAPIDAAQK